MPYRRRYNKKPLNKRLHGKNKRYRKGFKAVGPTNSLYRNPNPRTLQIATRRNTKQVLRFVSNQCYKVIPGGNVGGMENVFLKFRANSIYDINVGNSGNGALNANGTWDPQDAAVYGPSQPIINAEGFEDWKDRYSHFTVLGSKIQVTYEPIGIDGANVAVPCTAYINLAGNTSQIATGTEMSVINKLPYTKRASMVPAQTNSQQGGLVSSSTWNNQGNDQLKGDMLASPAVPIEGSFFTVGLRNTIPSGTASDRMLNGILRVKIEYITLLTEPTSTNKVQEPARAMV
jgi:hypothetical protein